MPILKGPEASLSYVQCFLYLISSSINACIFHIKWLDTFWTKLIYSIMKYYSASKNNKICIHATTEMSLEDIMLSEIRQTKEIISSEF